MEQETLPEVAHAAWSASRFCEIEPRLERSFGFVGSHWCETLCERGLALLHPGVHVIARDGDRFFLRHAFAAQTLSSVLMRSCLCPQITHLPCRRTPHRPAPSRPLAWSAAQSRSQRRSGSCCRGVRAAEGVAQDHEKAWCTQVDDRIQHRTSCLHDPAGFLIAPGQEARGVPSMNAMGMSASETDEACVLVRCVDVDLPGSDRGIVGYESAACPPMRPNAVIVLRARSAWTSRKSP